MSESGKHAQFFDLKGYFQAESKRLAKENPWVTKSVKHNADTETKKVQIQNWESELSFFTESDINKPAWRESYSVSNSEGLLAYRAKDPDLKTREVLVKKIGDTIKWLVIFNHTRNTLFGKKHLLYENIEKLTYYPDSLYLIQKLQRVRFLETQKYTIKGVFN